MYEIRMAKAIQIDDSDNVATVTSELTKGESVEVLSPQGEMLLRLNVSDDIPFGHKIALENFSMGDEIIKYGEVIGVAATNIQVGTWLHTHNVESVRVPTSKLREAIF
jgi:altronate dehydratase small subunit